MKIIKFHGGLGNQMFQYCFYKRMMLESDEVLSDTSFFKKVKAHNGLEIERLFNIKFNKIDKKIEIFLFSKNKIIKLKRSVLKKINRFKIYTYFDTVYDESIITNSRRFSYYEGYWQSEKYFKVIKEEIRKKLIFPEIVEEKNLQILKNIREENSISIHVRRGDYVGHPQLDGLAPIEYYEKAIEYLKKKIENPKFFIFSNDLSWCKENLPLKENEYEVVEGNTGDNSYIDMQLMSLCKHNIIPNSSFSWWGAWLNKNPQKIVIAPERWFTKESKFLYEDIVPKEWIKLKNY